MRHRILLASLLAAALTLPAGSLPAQNAPSPVPNTPAAPAPALTPAVANAIKLLSADEFETREKAVADLQLALGAEMHTMLLVDTPEAQARLNDLLSFEQGLCEWCKDVLKLPPNQQKQAFEFGLQPEVLPHVAHLYARETSVRLDAVRSLRKITDPRVTDLLAHAIDDPEQQVYVAAMEGVYVRKPTDAVANALWSRAVAAQFATFRPQPQPVPDRITFLGQPLQVLSNGDNSLYLRTQDNALATQVLIHLKPPQILPRIRTLFQETEAVYNRRAPNGGIDDQNVWQYMPSQEAMRNAISIAAAYQDAQLVPGLYRIATGTALQKSAGQMNRQNYFWSNRTWAIALIVQLAGQKPEDWGLRTMSQLQGMWTVPTEADESAAIRKLRDWWSKEHEKYNSPADTRPAPEENPNPPPDPQPIPFRRGNPVQILPLSE